LSKNQDCEKTTASFEELDALRVHNGVGGTVQDLFVKLGVRSGQAASECRKMYGRWYRATLDGAHTGHILPAFIGRPLLLFRGCDNYRRLFRPAQAA
jgi:hypothetical protein